MASPRNELLAAWMRAARDDLGSAVKQARNAIGMAGTIFDFVKPLLPVE